MGAVIAMPELCLPWESSHGEDRRFGRILRAMLLAFLAAGVAVPLLPVADLPLPRQEETPPHLARILLEKKALPDPEPEPEPEPEPIPKPAAKPEPKPEPKVVPPTPAREPVQPVDQLQRARDDARAAGVLAFRDDLMDMRDSLDVAELDQAQDSRGESAAARVERSLIAANRAGSGGIDTSTLSRDAGGPALSGREATRVQSDIAADTGTRRTASAPAENPGGRSDASIRRVMDRNKGAIFSVYNRALRRDPLLQGKLVFEMVIEPSGRVSGLALLSSELQDAALTDKILARIRMIDFGAENVLATRVNYSFDFLPYG